MKIEGKLPLDEILSRMGIGAIEGNGLAVTGTDAPDWVVQATVALKAANGLADLVAEGHVVKDGTVPAALTAYTTAPAAPVAPATHNAMLQLKVTQRPTHGRQCLTVHETMIKLHLEANKVYNLEELLAGDVAFPLPATTNIQLGAPANAGPRP